MKIYDITLPFSGNLLTYPGDPPVVIERVADVADGSPFTLSSVSMGSHSGTHVDAPSHLFPGRGTVDELPLDVLMGDALVLEFQDTAQVGSDELEAASIPDTCRRLLLKTGRSDVYLTEDGARWITDRGIGLVGIDTMSVDAPDSRLLEAHQVMLEKGVIIVESLLLKDVPPGEYYLVCLPLKLVGVDGSPVRAVLIDQDIP